jgi:hypothetical protein
MMNFSLGAFWYALDVLGFELDKSLAGPNAHTNRSRAVPDGENARTRANLREIFEECRKLRLEKPEHIIGQLSLMFDRPHSYGELAENLQAFQNAVVADAKEQMFFHYPRDAALELRSIDAVWTAVFEAFPSAVGEVRAGIDCRAFGDLSGSVFHMVRAAEIGLRALARERGIKTIRSAPVEYAMWGNIIGAIEAEAEKIRKDSKIPAGPKKEAALAFYSAAASDLRAILKLFRDRSMHFRDKYDPGEAQSAIFRTKSFLEMLAPYINETRPKRIRWGWR